MKKLFCGIDIIENESLKYHNAGILCHPASVNKELQHILELDLDVTTKAIFTPQHGLYAHTQANMVEWKGGFLHHKYKIPVYSLYGDHRKPIKKMLEGLDVIIIDLFDIGARYYTYIWTAALAMEAASEAGIDIIVLDRPNPIGGRQISGPIVQDGFYSFVGLYPLPIRHGMTIGEIMKFIHAKIELSNELVIYPVENWDRGYYDEYDYPWVMPSPNMPTLDTAIVYPGQCLLEATSLSEGRGTTRPFELMGAPFIDPDYIIPRIKIPGAILRQASFVPTFDKFADKLCHGFQIHVVSREDFDPVQASWEILRTIRECYIDEFKWLGPPYEYEYYKMPIEILIGSTEYAQMLNHFTPFQEASKQWQAELDDFIEIRKEFLLY